MNSENSICYLYRIYINIVHVHKFMLMYKTFTCYMWQQSGEKTTANTFKLQGKNKTTDVIRTKTYIQYMWNAKELVTTTTTTTTTS